LAFSDGSARGWLAAVDPRLKIIWIACVSLAGVLVQSSAAMAVMFTVAALPATGLMLRPRGWMAMVIALTSVAWGAVVTQGIFYGGEPRTALFTIVPDTVVGSWEFPGVHFYREGAIYGLTQAVRWLALTTMGLTVCLSTSPERLLAALVRLRVPTAVAFMALAAMRFLPVMLDEWASVRRARWLRGYRGAHGIQCISAEVRLLVPVLASALRRATALATSVTCRGFSPTAQRTFYPELQMRRGERVALVAIVAISVALALAWTTIWLGPMTALSGWPQFEAFLEWVRRWL